MLAQVAPPSDPLVIFDAPALKRARFCVSAKLLGDAVALVSATMRTAVLRGAREILAHEALPEVQGPGDYAAWLPLELGDDDHVRVFVELILRERDGRVTREFIEATVDASSP